MGDQFALARYDVDGHLDGSFGQGGKVLTDFAATADERVHAIVIDGRSRIVAGGWAANADGGYRFALARYMPDGRLDADFGQGGTVLTDFLSSDYERVHAIAIDDQGRIVAGGEATIASSGKMHFALARYTADGDLDTSFNRDGKVLTGFASGFPNAVAALAIDARGGIVAGGWAQAEHGGLEFALARCTSDGGMDAGFGHGGKVWTDFMSAAAESISALVTDTEGRIVVGGWGAVSGGGYQFALARYSSDGRLDAGFGHGGKILTDLTASSAEYITSLAIDGHGRIVAGGWGDIPGGETRFALARYTSDGDLDSAFGQGGIVLTSLARTSSGRAYAVAIDGKDRIVAGGEAVVSGGGTQFALARFRPDGKLDNRFGDRGMVLTDFVLSDRECIRSVAIDRESKIVVGGWAAVIR
jgi:uncharacterized delta-60 repeat protein